MLMAKDIMRMSIAWLSKSKILLIVYTKQSNLKRLSFG
jgi:hypothetical protein